MRYKKRFFMTIFGIGGCMALMLVGYGVKDSVYEIADIQYDEIQLYDGHIFYKDDVTKTEKEELKEYLKEDTDIQTYMDARMQSVTASKENKNAAFISAYLAIRILSENMKISMTGRRKNHTNLQTMVQLSVRRRQNF